MATDNGDTRPRNGPNGLNDPNGLNGPNSPKIQQKKSQYPPP